MAAGAGGLMGAANLFGLGEAALGGTIAGSLVSSILGDQDSSSDTAQEATLPDPESKRRKVSKERELSEAYRGRGRVGSLYGRDRLG